MKLRIYHKAGTSIGMATVLFLASFGQRAHSQEPVNLVPDDLATAPNYWCTWYWQNYLIKKGEKVEDPNERNFSNQAAREQLNEDTLFGEDGMAKVILPDSRKEYYFLIDHGWQDKSIKGNVFFSLIMEPSDFPSYAHLEPKDRLKQLNEDIKALGWRGLGIWVRGTPKGLEEAKRLVGMSKYAGIEYWKIDGGDTKAFLTDQAKEEIYPELTLEYVTGSGGPLNIDWNKPDLTYYPSVYEPGTKHVKDEKAGPGKASEALRVIEHVDVFRTYDAVPLLVSTVTLQRIHDILKQTQDNPKYGALLNIQDDVNIAAALGCVVAVKRHPMKTPRMFEGRDFHFQIAGNRDVPNRTNEMDRFIRWQRIAPPMPAGYGSYSASPDFLIDHFEFRPGDTWKTNTWGKMVYQSAPAIMARNIPLPKVKIASGEPPYVLASKFPNGAVCIATEGRVKPDESWYHPKADISLKCGAANGPIGVFGYYGSLTLSMDAEIPEGVTVWAQDLLADKATDITDRIEIKGNDAVIPGEVIEDVGTSENNDGDISVPGLVLKIE